MNIDLLDKFSTNLKKTLFNAANLASNLGENEVTPIHLLAGIFEQKGCLALEVLKRQNISRKTLDSFLKNTDFIKSKKSTPLLSGKVKCIIEKATLFSFEANHNYVGTEHLLLAMMDVEDNKIKKILQNKASIKKQLDTIFKNTSRFPDLTSLFSTEDEGVEEILEGPMPVAKSRKPHSEKETDIPALSFFCTDLTNFKIQTKIDPVIGRDNEIERAIHILCRRTKNNPVLIGEPGVGKTAIVEGLAKRIVEKKVPPALINKKIFRLDLSLVVVCGFILFIFVVLIYFV